MQPSAAHSRKLKEASLVGGGEALRLKNYLTERKLWLPRVFHRIATIPAQAADEQVSGELLVNTLETAMIEFRQPGLPIEFGSAIRTVDLGLYGMAIQTSATVGDALDRSARFFGLIVTAGRVILQKNDKAVRWVYQSADDNHFTARLGIRIRNEIILTEHVTLLRFIAPGCRPTRVNFSHAKPPDAKAHQRFFNCPLHWDAEENSVEWSLATMQRSLGVDSSLGDFIEREAERRLESIPKEGSLTDVKNAILRRLPTGDADLQTISELLGRSTRTLRRELIEQGFTFRSLRDLVRQQRATEMIDSEKYSMTQIAQSLGFSEASALSRASRRWTGDFVKSRSIQGGEQSSK